MGYDFINIICHVCGEIYEKTRKIAGVKGICKKCEDKKHGRKQKQKDPPDGRSFLIAGFFVFSMVL